MNIFNISAPARRITRLMAVSFLSVVGVNCVYAVDTPNNASISNESTANASVHSSARLVAVDHRHSNVHAHDNFASNSSKTDLFDQIFIGRTASDTDSGNLDFWRNEVYTAQWCLSRVAWGYYNTPESRQRIERVMGLTSGTLKHTTWVLTDAQFIDSLNKIVVRQDASTNQTLLAQLADGIIARQDVMDRFVESNILYQSFMGGADLSAQVVN